MLTHSELTLVNHYVSTLPTLTAYCMQNHEEEEKSFQSHIFATRCTLCKREPDPGSGLVPRHAREIARALVIGPTQEPCRPNSLRSTRFCEYHELTCSSSIYGCSYVRAH